MSNYQNAIDNYLALWNEHDEAVLRREVARVCADNFIYVDPMAVIANQSSFVEAIKGIQQAFAGQTFVLVGSANVHHNVARFTWHLQTAQSSEPTAIGFDVAVFADNGKIERVIGFLDKLPAA